MCLTLTVFHCVSLCFTFTDHLHDHAKYFAKKSLCFKIVKQQIHFTFIFFNLLPMHNRIRNKKPYKNDKNKTKTPVFKTVNFKLQSIL